MLQIFEKVGSKFPEKKVLGKLKICDIFQKCTQYSIIIQILKC